MRAAASTRVPARAPRRRRSPGWVPNQHGAWVMLATPLLVGAIASGPRWGHLLLAAFWFAGYFAFFATTLWLKSRRRPRYLPPVRTYVVLATVLGLLVLWLQPGLLRWAPLFLVPLGVGLVASATRHERALTAGLATAAGSCLMTLVSYDVGPGQDWTRAWVLAAVLAAYFAGTVFYVKSAIRERGNKRFQALSVAYHAACTVAMAWVSWPLVAVFAGLTLRAAVVPPRGYSPKALGIGEIVATVVVAVAALLTA